ncbi:SdpI family protein [Streptomyces sp. ST2-7A]|uniref:SdpI family protein n=1 Tax=Streptomyces sp. ST2-7A TaxID=2907214 RepID=UPI001F45F128|nr:SdpI family protein [Streptomyces sp. ST2-7A]MCE7082043.1 SdpI family protein [Streptomyces sp. ST2-7A]
MTTVMARAAGEVPIGVAWLILVVLLAGGAAVGVTTVMAARGKLSRNALAGIRTGRSMASDENWLLMHRVARPWAVAGGAVMGLVAPTGLLTSDESVFGVVVTAGTLLSLIPLFIGVHRGTRAIKERERKDGSGSASGSGSGIRP